MAKLLSLAILLAAYAAAQSVEGSVFDAATGTGVAGVKVELLKGATPFYETATDGGGRFRFDNVREGDYAARYQSPDYWLTAGPSDYRVFHVAGTDPVKLEARLMPWSKLSGRVVDSLGRGVPDAPVQVTGSGMMVNGRTYLRTSWGGGGGGALTESPPPMTFFNNTDAHGRFEVQVMPGNYGLSVAPPPGFKPPGREADGPLLTWTWTWYPGVASREAASRIALLPGAEVDIELRLLAVPVHAVRGVVLAPDGTPAPKAAVSMGEGFHRTSVESKDDGTFEFPAVGEGEWRFAADLLKQGVKLRATEWIEVTAHDLENVKLRLAPPLTMRGKVVVDAPESRQPPRLPGFILAARGGRNREESDLAPGVNVLINQDANGNLTAEDLYPGAYRLAPQMQPPPPPYYLDAVRVGGGDLASGDVEISSDVTITVVYKTDGGSVRGTAEHCASGGVLLVSQEPSLWRRGFSRSGPCDASDRYEVRAVRPGDYYAVAFAGNGPVLPVDETLLKEAVKVTVRAGEASAADLSAVTRPVY